MYHAIWYIIFRCYTSSYCWGYAEFNSISHIVEAKHHQSIINMNIFPIVLIFWLLASSFVDGRKISSKKISSHSPPLSHIKYHSNTPFLYKLRQNIVKWTLGFKSFVRSLSGLPVQTNKDKSGKKQKNNNSSQVQKESYPPVQMRTLNKLADQSSIRLMRVRFLPTMLQLFMFMPSLS